MAKAKRAPKFDIRKSPVDGKFRVWSRVRLSTLRPLETDEIDGPIWVVTGVFKTRKEIFDAV